MLTISKDQVWEETFDRVARFADATGRRLDPGIIGLVLALNAHGITTTASCEGHLDRALPFPWVRFQGSLSALLDAFTKRSGDHRLVIKPFFDEQELRCAGSSRQMLRFPESRARHLAAYREEMNRFALFLRDEFFREPLIRLSAIKENGANL